MSKLTDLFLAEKNLADFVDKNLGQERDRLKQDELELEFVCGHMVGGSLDYPVMMSHDFCDITTAWDIYLYSFTKDTRAAMPTKFGHGVNAKPFVKNPRWGKIPFTGEELSPRQFCNAIVMCGQKIKQHIIDCTLECTNSGRLENLYCIISNVVVIRNYIWMFQELFDAECKNKLKPEYTEFCDLEDVISEQMVQAQSNLLLTFVIHDEESQAWGSNRAYYEGERGSPTIQMWAYFLRNFQQDMWRIMPPQLAQRILGTVLSDSLGVLTARYSKARPTADTVSHYVCDVLNILAMTEELMFCISPDLQLFSGEGDPVLSKPIYSIHLKCSCLVASLILLGCPLEVLYKTFRRGLSSCALMEKHLLHPLKLSEPGWTTVVRKITPKFYPNKLSMSDWELLSTLRLVSSQPAPTWPLVYRAVTMQDCRIAKFILTLFPTVMAPVDDFMLEGKAFQRCGKASCILPDCHSLAKSLPNHFAASSTVYIVAHATSRDIFRKVYRTVMSKVIDWSVMDKTQIWNCKSRPVWFQSLIDLLLPILKTCVQSLCLTILGMEKSLQHTEEQFTQFVHELLSVLAEMLSVIPRGFFLVCEEMDDMIPPSYHPVRNNVPVHFLVTALYMLLNLGPKLAYIPPSPPQGESYQSRHDAVGKKSAPTSNTSAFEESKKWKTFLEPVLLSVAERLCHLDDRIFDQAVHRLITQIESMLKQMKQESPSTASLAASVGMSYETEWEVAQVRSDFLVQELEGQLALRIVYWFMKTHTELLQDVIITSNSKSGQSGPQTTTSSNGIETSKSPTSAQAGPAHGEYTALSANATLKVAPRIRTYIKATNVIHDFRYVSRQRLFDEVLWSPDCIEWVEVVRCTKLGLHKAIALKILERRWEFQQNDEDSTSDKKKFISQMTDEIRALMMA